MGKCLKNMREFPLHDKYQNRRPDDLLSHFKNMLFRFLLCTSFLTIDWNDVKPKEIKDTHKHIQESNEEHVCSFLCGLL